MRRVVKWVGLGLAGLMGLAVVDAAAVWILGGRVIARTYDVPTRGFQAAPADSATIQAGRRLTTMRGCDDCHGPQLEGAVFFDDPLVARLVAPNLPAIARQYSDADLERAIRHGVRPSRRTLFAMPSPVYYHLSDADLAAIIAFIRSAPTVDNALPGTRIGLLGRLGLLTGQYSPEAALVEHAVPRLGDEPTTEPVALGRYLAKTTCAECHGLDLQGGGFLETPALSIVAGYSEPEFATLLRRGVALGDRELEVMTDVATARLSVMTDEEVHALYAYLSTLSPDSDTRRS